MHWIGTPPLHHAMMQWLVIAILLLCVQRVWVVSISIVATCEYRCQCWTRLDEDVAMNFIICQLTPWRSWLTIPLVQFLRSLHLTYLIVYCRICLCFLFPVQTSVVEEDCEVMESNSGYYSNKDEKVNMKNKPQKNKYFSKWPLCPPQNARLLRIYTIS